MRPVIITVLVYKHAIFYIIQSKLAFDIKLNISMHTKRISKLEKKDLNKNPSMNTKFMIY